MIDVPQHPGDGPTPSTSLRAGPGRSRRRRIIIWGAQVVVIVVVVSTAAWAFGAFSGSKPAAAPDDAAARAVLKVTTAPVTQGSISGKVHLTGTVQSADPRQVTPAASGKLATMPVTEGSKVKAGQVVATLSDTDGALTLTVVNATSNLAKARQELDRLEHPVADSGQLGQARASVDSAQEALDNARRKKDKAESGYEKAKDKYDHLNSEAKDAASHPSGSDTGSGSDSSGVSQNDLSMAASNLSAAKSRRDAARDEVTAAEQQLHQTERTLDAYQHLAPAPDSQTEPVRAQVDAARQQLDIARRNLAALTVTAPVAGTVTSVPLLVGATVTPSSVILRIDSGGFEAKAAVEPTVAAALASHPRTPVAVTGAGLPRLAATVRTVSPTTDAASDRTNVTFTLKPPTKAVVRPGATVAVDVTLPAATGLVVPADAVVSDGQDTVVYTVTPQAEEATAHRVRVSLLTADAKQALVAGDGLAVGSQIVVTGQTQLVDGTKVKIASEGADGDTA
jgi:RND family efflux transporter MFP subunit